MLAKKEDTAFWESFLKGDRESFGLLFKKYYSQLYQYGNKICRDKNILEDTIQELFLDIWRSKNPVPIISVKAYLIKALKYKLLKQISGKHSTNIPFDQSNEPFEIPQETFIISKQEDEEKSKKLVKALEQLSNRQKEIIYLKFYQGLNYDEVSEVMNINYQVARNLLSQAIKSLKKILLDNSLLRQLLL